MLETPTSPRIIFDDIFATSDIVPKFPAELKKLKRWGAHRGKRPFNVLTGTRAQLFTAGVAVSYELACSQVFNFDGLGYGFQQQDGISGIDLDDVRDPAKGFIQKWAADLIYALDSYTEISPSGKGVHIFVRGTVDKGRKRDGVEIYSSGRYFTVTGNHLPGTPLTINVYDAQSLADRIEEREFAAARGIPIETKIEAPKKEREIDPALESLKQKVGIEPAVLRGYTGEIGQNVPCPFHDPNGDAPNHDGHQSFAFVPATDGSRYPIYKCQSTHCTLGKQPTGDIINYVMAIDGVDFATAKQRIVAEYAEAHPSIEIVKAEHIPAAITFPEDYDSDAMIGVLGDFVKYALPFSEADANNLLGQSLAVVGNFLGRKRYANYAADVHYSNLNVAIIGGTGSGKGQGGSMVELLAKSIDPKWQESAYQFSAASGEALVRLLSNKDDARVVLQVPEMSILFNSMNRDGSTLSGYLRHAYDGKIIQHNKVKVADSIFAKNYHLSVVGQITPQELVQFMGAQEFYNGTANRFIWNLVQRSKSLPRQSKRPNFTEIGMRIAMQGGIPVEGESMQADFTDAGGKVWDEFYEETKRLHDRIDPKLAASQQRFHANALRTALVYAQLDESWAPGQPLLMEAKHVRAAVAIVERSRESAAWFLKQPLVKLTKASDFEATKRIIGMNNRLKKDGLPFTNSVLKSMFKNTADADERSRLMTDAGMVITSQPGAKPVVWDTLRAA
jgi:hypothetical protein